MIDISHKLSPEVEDWFVSGFISRIRYRLYKSPQPVKPVYSFERKFYRKLALDRSCAFKFITMSPKMMETVFNSPLFKKHRLFFLLCLPKEVRHSKAFGFHTYREFKNLPKDACGIPIDELSNLIRERAIKIFDYGYFSKKPEDKVSKSGWNAYSFSQKVMPKTCPFCNTSPNKLLIKNDEAKARPALDHYFCQSKYPFFGVNIKNLVPSCTICNSTLKQKLDFINIPHVSPYERGITNNFMFTIRPKVESLTDIWEHISTCSDFNSEELSIQFDSIDSTSQMDNNAATFNIAGQHDCTKDQYLSFISKLARTKKSALKDILPILEGLDNRYVGKTIDEAGLLYLDVPDEEHAADIAFTAIKNSLYKIYFC
ncbi:hypothetical protein AB6E36_06090 [Vibrio cyclitrophicus]